MTVEYTPLEQFAARISGKLALDAHADEGQGVAKIHATPSCLRDNKERLEDEGYNVELYLDAPDLYDHPTMLVHPRPGDLEDDDGREVPQAESEPSDYVKKMRREAAAKAWHGASERHTEDVNNGGNDG